MLHKPHLPGNLISKTKGKDTITDKDKEKDKDKDTEKFIGINTKTKAQNHEFRNIMNVCAGMLLEERNVCLCLVFVSLSPAASHQESCYSQDPHRPTRTSLYSGHLGTLVPGIMVHLVQGTMLHLVLLLSRPHCPPKILQL